MTPPGEIDFTTPVEFRMTSPPQAIDNRLNVGREDAREYTGFHHVGLGEYRLAVDIGVRGGIDSIRAVRDIHH